MWPDSKQDRHKHTCLQCASVECFSDSLPHVWEAHVRCFKPQHCSNGGIWPVTGKHYGYISMGITNVPPLSAQTLVSCINSFVKADPILDRFSPATGTVLYKSARGTLEHIVSLKCCLSMSVKTFGF